MANDLDLLDDRRGFLLGVDYGDPTLSVRSRPGRVSGWPGTDLAGSGSTALRSYFGAVFTKRVVREFTMMSLDQKNDPEHDGVGRCNREHHRHPPRSDQIIPSSRPKPSLDLCKINRTLRMHINGPDKGFVAGDR
jgi:hypothetical protein